MSGSDAEVRVPTPVLLWNNSMSVEHAASDNSDGHDANTGSEGTSGPSEEEYRKPALRVTEDTVHEQIDHIKEKLGEIQSRLREREREFHTNLASSRR